MRLWWVVLFSVVTAIGVALLWKYSWGSATGYHSLYPDDEDTTTVTVNPGSGYGHSEIWQADPYPSALLARRWEAN